MVSLVDEDRAGLVETGPVGDRVGDELGPVVEADEDGRAALCRQTLEAGDDTVGINGTLDVGGQGLPRELVEDVQET